MHLRKNLKTHRKGKEKGTFQAVRRTNRNEKSHLTLDKRKPFCKIIKSREQCKKKKTLQESPEEIIGNTQNVKWKGKNIYLKYQSKK